MSISSIKSMALAMLAALATSANAQSVTDSLRTLLAQAQSPADSITILYNILDSSPYSRQGEPLEDLYNIAHATGNTHELNEILKLETNFFTFNDSMLQVIDERIAALPDGDEKKSTQLFFRVRTTAQKSRKLPEKKRQAKMRECYSKYINSDGLDPYEQVEYLFYLCTFLRSATEGDLLTRYLMELQAKIDMLPTRDIALKSLFYTQAALCYITNEMYPQAVEADKNLLSIIKELERQYEAKGRVYRNYDRSAYICFRRLLRCHEALTPEEIENYYNRVKRLADTDPTLRHDFDTRPLPTIYYLMAQKRYAEALPIIVGLIDNPKNSREEMIYLSGALATAADAVGDKPRLLQALKINNDLLKKRIEAKAAESYRELQIVYEMNNLRQENSNLAVANEEMLTHRHREQMMYTFIALMVLLVLLALLFKSYRKAKKMSASLMRSNAIIAGERDNLKRTQRELIEARDRAKSADRIKTDFVNNMSHEIRTPLAAIVEYSNLIADCAEEEKRGYIKRFADIVSLNTDLLLTLVNDVLDLPALENAKLVVKKSPTSAQTLCRMAVDSVKKHVAPGVSLTFANDNGPDCPLITDPHRVEQVLLNMLLNAAKFTPQGSIELRYDLAPDGKTLTFTVTDSGIGIPKGKEEAIFERFEKVDNSTQGNGLGLYISRLLAELLKGSLVLDKAYRRGARFHFTVPTE